MAEDLIAGWSHNGYRVFEKSDGKDGADILAEMTRPLPDQLPLIVGDALHCIRSSLDQIIFALSKAHTSNMSPEDEGDTAFPFPRKNPVTPNHDRIRFLALAAQLEVCKLAPDPTSQTVKQDPLWLLNDTENRDKHREIPIVAATLYNEGIRLSRATHFRLGRMTGDPQKMKYGGPPAVLAEGIVRQDTDAEIRHSLQVVFDEGTELANRQVISTLRWLHDNVRDTVFQALEPHL